MFKSMPIARGPPLAASGKMRIWALVLVRCVRVRQLRKFVRPTLSVGFVSLTSI